MHIFNFKIRKDDYGSAKLKAFKINILKDKNKLFGSCSK